MDQTFRAYDIKKNKWLLKYSEGKLGEFALVGEFMLFSYFHNMLREYSIEDLNDIVITQSTGRQNSDKQLIYSGDIILNPTATEPEDKGWIIFWNEYKWSAKLNDGHYSNVCDFDKDFKTEQFTTIGNIYEHKNLIK